MITKKCFPVLEFDDNSNALINPGRNDKFPYSKLVITFFKEVINKLLQENKIKEYYTVKGENDLIVYKFCDEDVLLIHGIIGCPACGGFLDELIGYGITDVMFCGGGGALVKNTDVGNLIVIEKAIRDEGFSYHYVKPSRMIEANTDVIKIINDYLDKFNIPYKNGITWTTDAFYRETVDKIKLRKEEGAVIVEMEQSGLIAVSQFRNIKYGAIIYTGDDVSSDVWDNRDWKSRESVRYNLVEICKEITKLL